MKKVISLALVLLMAVFCLCSCEKLPTAGDYLTAANAVLSSPSYSYQVSTGDKNISFSQVKNDALYEALSEVNENGAKTVTYYKDGKCYYRYSDMNVSVPTDYDAFILKSGVVAIPVFDEASASDVTVEKGETFYTVAFNAPVNGKASAFTVKLDNKTKALLNIEYITDGVFVKIDSIKTDESMFISGTPDVSEYTEFASESALPSAKLYIDASEKTGGASSYTKNTSVEGKISIPENEIKINNTSAVSYIRHDGNPELVASADNGQTGEHTEFYLKDGYAYISSEGKNIKHKLTDEELTQVISEYISGDKIIKAEDISDFRVKLENGKYIITFTPSGDIIKELTDMMADAEMSEAEASNVVITSVIDAVSGYIDNTTVKADLSFTMAEIKATAEMTVKNTYTDIDSLKSLVSAPDTKLFYDESVYDNMPVSYDFYLSAAEKAMFADSYKITTDNNISISLAGISQNVHMKTSLDVIGADNEPESVSRFDTNGVSSSVYYKDNVIYITSEASKVKMDGSFNDYLASVYVGFGVTPAHPFAESYIKDFKGGIRNNNYYASFAVKVNSDGGEMYDESAQYFYALLIASLGDYEINSSEDLYVDVEFDGFTDTITTIKYKTAITTDISGLTVDENLESVSVYSDVGALTSLGVLPDINSYTYAE